MVLPALQLRGKGAWEAVRWLGKLSSVDCVSRRSKACVKPCGYPHQPKNPSNRCSIFFSTFTLIALSCHNISLPNIPGQSVKVISHLVVVFAFLNLVNHINAIQRCVFFSALRCSMGVKPKGEGNQRSYAIFPTSYTSNLQMS